MKRSIFFVIEYGVNNYILNTDDNQITLDFSNLSPGVYVISLISNGKITDSQTIIKQ